MNQKGFSLLELSVALVIIALTVAFGLAGGKNALENSDRVSTQQRLATIQKAMEVHAKINGYLPCPARRDLIPTSSSFGVESRSGASCTVAGDIAYVPTSTPTVYIGAVPVRSLGLPDSYAADAWSNKFLYAVSANMVGLQLAYLTRDGAIVIYYAESGGTPYIVTTTRDGLAGASASYVVLSHGADGRGAYPLIGTAAATACGATAYNDLENCNDSNAVFYDAVFNNSKDQSAFFDDFIVWNSNALERMTDVAVNNPALSCLSSSGTACEHDINTAGASPDCDVTCTNAGYSASGATLTNCTYSASCATGGNLSCDYQCCCSGTPPSGCATTTTTWSTNCGGTVPTLAHGASTTVYNGNAGYSGSVTASCSGGTLSYTPVSCSAITTTSSSTGGTDGCSSGSCTDTCAPCVNNGPFTGNGGILCDKILIATSPCQAHCVYGGCGTTWSGNYRCYECP